MVRIWAPTGSVTLIRDDKADLILNAANSNPWYRYHADRTAGSEPRRVQAPSLWHAEAMSGCGKIARRGPRQCCRFPVAPNLIRQHCTTRFAT